MGCLKEFYKSLIIILYGNVFQNPELFQTQVSLSPEKSTLKTRSSGKMMLVRRWLIKEVFVVTKKKVMKEEGTSNKLGVIAKNRFQDKWPKSEANDGWNGSKVDNKRNVGQHNVDTTRAHLSYFIAAKIFCTANKARLGVEIEVAKNPARGAEHNVCKTVWLS
jgi:hypothetical protein